MQYPKNTKKEAGFTLIELSIVLVIIGLIVGGVLVGQDLIKAAEIRATISQIEKYNSAVNTFQGKYNAKPGDITGTNTGQAFQFGLFVDTVGTAGHGDGNGLIEGAYAGGVPTTAPVGEPLLFWRHLNDANLVDGSYGVVSPSLLTAAGTVTGTVNNVQQSIPQAKLGPAGSVIVYANSGLNYYQIVPVSTITTSAYTFGSTGMTPLQAFNIDAKLDDGAPNTGVVIARSLGVAGSGSANGVTGVNGAPSFNAVSTNNDCVVGTGAAATDTYNRVKGTGADDPSCSLRLRFN